MVPHYVDTTPFNSVEQYYSYKPYYEGKRGAVV